MSEQKLDATGLSQPGLFLEPEFSTLISLNFSEEIKGDPKVFLEKARQIQELAKSSYPHTYIVLGFAPFVNKDDPQSFLNTSNKFKDDGFDLLVYIKSTQKESHKFIDEKVTRFIESMAVNIEIVRSNKRHGGKVIGGRFLDGIRNPSDPITMTQQVLTKDKHGQTLGGTFALTQKFLYNWEAILSKSRAAQEDMIGRDYDSNILPIDSESRHIKRARVYDQTGQPKLILRQSLPFGQSGSGEGNEEGLMFVGFAKNIQCFEEILQNMIGHQVHGQVDDALMRVVQGVSGGYWYIPSAQELSIGVDALSNKISLIPIFNDRSKNKYMFYNSDNYLYAMTNKQYEPGDPPSDRVLDLLSKTFSFWQNKWYKAPISSEIPHLRNYLSEDEKEILHESVAVRKGMAIKKTLQDALVDSDYAKNAELYRIFTNDIIVGSMPFLSLGTGKQVMPYLRDDEKANSFVKTLNEFSSMGHIVPGYDKLLKIGLKELIAENKVKHDNATDKSTKDFYLSTILSLQGIQAYCLNYAKLAERLAQQPKLSSSDRENLLEIHQRMTRLSSSAPNTFLEATQLIFTTHCCLHIIGEPVGVGRLDQYLDPFLKKDSISEKFAQEVIDSFWIKLGEKVLLNRHHAPDTLTYGTTAVSFVGGNFPQGGALNQWVQQVTVGGYKASDGEIPEGACNTVTKLCLRSARRLPLNAPCLSLRTYTGMPKEIIDEASKAILSGGAHPILLSDEKMITALKQSGKYVTLKSARNYACDGCYEPMFAGQNEFSFGNVPLLNIVEFSLNQGALYKAAGPIHLRGLVNSYTSKHASEIKSFSELKEIFETHLEFQLIQFVSGILENYGSLAKICPSPLLSNFIEGCLEQGRDLTNGGTRYHVLAPMFVGMSFAADSMHAIKKLVFDPETAITTLPELLQCLKCDWGHEMKEPMQSSQIGDDRINDIASRYKYLREQALSLEKFGTGAQEVDDIAWWITKVMCQTAQKVLRTPDKLRFKAPHIAERLRVLESQYGSKEFPFEFQLTPGVGTFEGYVGDGFPNGASADGRRCSEPLASDFSPSPSPQDKAADPRYCSSYQALSSYNNEWVNFGIGNCAPVDMNIRETFCEKQLNRLIDDFAHGKIGSNLITLTCANEETYEQASKYPERYNLVRVRMGGWSEFYIAMFDAHQEQHKRRQFFTDEK